MMTMEEGGTTQRNVVIFRIALRNLSNKESYKHMCGAHALT